MTDLQQRQCGRKKIHHTLEDAQIRAKSLHKLKKAKFRAYRCPFCNGFHVGQIRSSAAAARRAERMAARA
jgi:hypothetical protein